MTKKKGICEADFTVLTSIHMKLELKWTPMLPLSQEAIML